MPLTVDFLGRQEYDYSLKARFIRDREVEWRLLIGVVPGRKNSEFHMGNPSSVLSARFRSRIQEDL